MKTTKLIGLYIFGFVMMMVTTATIVLASQIDFHYTDENFTANPTTDVGKTLGQATTAQTSVINILTKTFLGRDFSTQARASEYIQALLNFFLSLASFIALIMIIYGFYQMFFSTEHEKAYGTAKKTVVGAVTALVILAFSWLIVSYAFYLYNQIQVNI